MTEIAMLSTVNPMPDEPLTVPAAPPAEPDVSRFELALAQPFAVQPLPGEAVPPVSAAMMDNPATLGDRILSSVDSMRVHYRETLEKVDSTLNSHASVGESLPVQDMMRVMFEVTRLTLHEEMLSKLVGKTSQNLDTLLKGQ
ncbi:MAG TPA: type III secretion system inner rod subunit SctI [Geminicoccaceae bacterium]|nr:type III secretion system inner rod subunit SctI [Geminicoccaceae bacterium]